MENDIVQFKRGQVWWIKELPFEAHIQAGERPVCIISNDIGNKYSPILIVAPVTSQVKQPLPTHVEYKIDGRTNIILLEQIRTVNKDSIKNYIGFLTDKIMNEVDKAIAISLGLPKADINYTYTEPQPVIAVTTTTINSEPTKINYGKRFGVNEQLMIEKYLKCHTRRETLEFFKDKCNLSEKALSLRIYRIAKKM